MQIYIAACEKNQEKHDLVQVVYSAINQTTF